MTSYLLAVVWEKVTGRPYYTGQQASMELGLPPSVTSGVAYANLPEQLRHELWLRAKATDSAGQAAIAAELARMRRPELASAAGRRLRR